MALTQNQMAFFLIALHQRPKSADALFQRLPPTEGQNMTALYAELSSRRDADLKKVARSELRKMASQKISHSLADVHDDWLADMLRAESPLMIATILRYLPAERVHHILNVLPEAVLAAMPKLNETYAIPQSLVSHLKRKFESFFALKTTATRSELNFDHVFLLRAAQVSRFFLEAGYREIALGLRALPEEARGLVLDRLQPRDRERVKHYLSSTQAVAEQRIKRAQVHLISKQVDPRDSGIFVKELGSLLFAKALLAKDAENLDLIYKKMSKADALALKTLIQDYIDKNTEASVKTYREDLLEAVRIVLGGAE